MSKVVDQFPSYTISKSGEVTNLRSGKKLKHSDNGNGYCRVVLINESGKWVKQFIHRLVAKAYIPNPLNKPQVNHIDGKRSNHSVENLEWVSQSENDKHSFDKLGRTGSFKGRYGFNHPNATRIVSSDGKVYGSMAEAQRNGFWSRYIRQAINVGKTYKGLLWEELNG